MGSALAAQIVPLAIFQTPTRVNAKHVVQVSRLTRTAAQERTVPRVQEVATQTVSAKESVGIAM